jgi:hypothetical protein
MTGVVYAISSRTDDTWWGGPRVGWVTEARDALRFPSYTGAICYAFEECEMAEAAVSIVPIADDTPELHV